MSQHQEVGAADVFRLQIWRMVSRACRQSGLTQAEIGRRIGVSRSQVCVWLREPRHMTLDAASRLLAGVGARIDCVLTMDAT
jgi:hypothetical protein